MLFKKSLADFGVKWVFVEVTNICNMHCVFCPSDHLARPRKSMDFSLFKRTIDQIAKLKPPTPIMLHILGEPLLHKDIFNFIDYCASKNIGIILFTNCTQIKDKIGDICKRNNIHDLVLSVQTPTEETYKLRNFSKPFQEYMQDIYSAVDFIIKSKANEKMKVEIHLAETKLLPFRDWDVLTDSKEGLKIVKEICQKIKPDGDFADIPENFIDLPESDYWGYELLPNIFIRIKHFCSFGTHNVPGRVIEKTLPINCINTSNNLCVLVDGTITNCCLDTEGDLALGNIRDTKIINALKSKKRKEIIKDSSKFKLCRRCQGEITTPT